MGDALENLLKYEELPKHTIKKSPKASSRSWKGSSWKWIFWSVFKQKPGCIISDRKYSVVRANATNCRNWCPATTLGMFFWVWFDLWRLLRETVSKFCSLLEVILLLTINLSTLSRSLHTCFSERRLCQKKNSICSKSLKQEKEKFYRPFFATLSLPSPGWRSVRQRGQIRL